MSQKSWAINCRAGWRGKKANRLNRRIAKRAARRMARHTMLNVE